MRLSVSRNARVSRYEIMGLPLFEVDGFYENADELVALLDSTRPAVWKAGAPGSMNGSQFEDLRHSLQVDGLDEAYSFVRDLIGRRPLSQDLLTNYMRFADSAFNSFETHYWWPHLDEGFTAIIYLNRDDTTSGTNLYEPADGRAAFHRITTEHEHARPWQPKEDWGLLHSIRPAFNRLVVFDAFRFWHGANVCDRRYFTGEFRKNQVMFFAGDGE